ncbi:MAG: hypothetical protein KBS93_02880 [Flavobacteriaceae bacterium]|nr:hypothetical protein [Candidatus Onthonaster equi]
MNTEFEKILNYSKDHKYVIAIFQDPSGTDFWAGYVIDFNEEFFVMQHITKFGKKDGIIIEPMYKVRRIDRDDYCKCLQYIYDHNQELDEEQEILLDIPKDDNWMYSTLLRLKGETDYLIRIGIGNDTRFSGFVTEVSENDFILKCIGHDGLEEGNIYFMNEDINSFRINDLESRRRLMLYNYRRSFDFYDE